MTEGATAGESGLIGVFVDLVPPGLLASINATIESVRHEWRPADGRRACAAAREFADQLRRHEDFRAVEAQACAAARRWASRALHRELDDRPLHVLRCVDARMSAQSYLRHFDSHVLTLLVPLQLAHGDGHNGDLIVHEQPHGRVSRPLHLLMKAWLYVEHALPFFARRLLAENRHSGAHCRRIRCRPGNVYVFNGFVTLHHNLHVHEGERRTLIIHHCDAGFETHIRSVLRALRGVRDHLYLHS